MIYKDIKEAIGDTLLNVEVYNKTYSKYDNIDRKYYEYIDKHWTVMFFSKGVLIEEFSNEYYESGAIGYINENDINDLDELPIKEVVDIINKHK